MTQTRLLVVLGVLLVPGLGGCPDEGKRPLGDNCDSDDDCQSGFCAQNACLDPSADDDFDGVTNGVEGGLGSNPLQADSDYDGVLDGEELTTEQSGVDTDRDGKLDVVESRTLDADGDCITDQFDAEDDVANTDLSPMRDVVCRTAGICAEQLDGLGVACPRGLAVCVYAGIEGFSETETRCDGRDENCDGRVDEGFPPGCDLKDFDLDGVSDAIDVCPETFDSEQRDSNGDGIGDACTGLYTIVFSPEPPTALTAGERFDVSGAVVKTDLADPAAPMPRYRGRVDLLSRPAGGLGGPKALTPIDNAFTFAELSFTRAGTWHLVLTSGIGATESAEITVSAADAMRLSLLAPTQVVAGESIALGAIAYDAFDNVADLDAAATLTSDDPAAELPPAGSFSDGAWSLAGVVLHRAGTTTVTLAAGGLEASAEVNVVPGAVAAVELILPPSARAGIAVDALLTAKDGSGNVATGFAGAFAVSSDDPQATLPELVTLTREDAGQVAFQVVFGTPGLRTVNAVQHWLVADAQTEVGAGRPYRLVLGPSAQATPSVPHPIDVAIVDAYGNPAIHPGDPYLGTVTFRIGGTQPDIAPLLPGPTTFTAADLSALTVMTTWFRAGIWRLTATGTDLAVPSASVDVPVSLNPATTLALTLPTEAKAGVPVPLTLTVRDAAGNLATDFSGTVALVSDDSRALLPARVVLAPEHGGTRTIEVTFASPGLREVRASVGGLGDEAEILVRAGAPHAVVLTADSPVVIEQARTVQATIIDELGNLADDPADSYTGTITFSVVGAQPPLAPTLPGPHTMTASDGSRFAGEVTWFSAGTYTLRVDAPGLVRSSDSEDIRVVEAVGLSVALPDTVKTDVPVDVVVSAVALDGAVATGFTGTVTLRDDDPRSNLPGSITFAPSDRGTRTLSVTFGTVGLRTVTASGGGFVGRDTTTVLAGAPAQIHIAPRGIATTGTPLGVDVTITDRHGQVADDPNGSYVGTVTFDIAGVQPEVAPTLPGPTTFTAADRSRKTVDTVWFRVGTYTLRATGTGLTNATATADVTVVGTAAAALELTLPASARAGQSVPMTVTVRDAAGQIAAGFVGTIAIAVDEVGTQLPAFIELDHQHAGTRTVNVVFGKAGLRTVVASHEDLTARASITISPAAPHRITLLGPHTGTTGEGLLMRVAILDAFGNIANDPTLSYTGTVTFTATGPSPLPPFYVPRLQPSIPEPKTFTVADGSNFVFSTQWFHPGRWTLRASGTSLATPTASLGFEITVGPATRFDILAPETFPAGSNPQAWVRATDAWRNTDPSFNGPAFISGFEDAPESVTLVAGEATKTFPLTMTIAGPYTIVAQDGTLYGELAVQVTHATAYRLLATGPDQVVEDTNATITVTVADEFFNTVLDYEGSVDVDVSSFTDYSPPELDFDFVAADQGERDVTILFFSPGPRTLTFDGSPGISPEGVTSHDLLVLSNLPPVYLEISKPAEGPLWVNVPYADGFHVGVFDDNGDPTAAEQDMTVTVALDEQYPGPTTLGGTLARLIPQGRHGALFDDLLFPIDGNYTLSARPSIDFPDDVSDPFDVFYRAPTVTIDGLTQEGGCVSVDYSVAQPDGAPVTVRVTRRSLGEEQLPWGWPASQAASDVTFSGHFELPGGAHSYLWNAARDLDYTTESNTTRLTVSARAGWHQVANPHGTDEETITLTFAEDDFCQRGVTAVRGATPRVDVAEPDSGLWSPDGALASADVNGDGKLDLLRGSSDGRVGVSMGRGDGGFQIVEILVGHAFPGAVVTRIVTADFNDDGATDIALSLDDGTIEIWVRDLGANDLAFTFEYDLDSQLASPIAARDMDGDGLWDLVYVGEDGEVTVAYQAPGGIGLSDEIVVALVEIVPELVIVNVEGRHGLDLVFYQMRPFINDGLPDADHDLCLVRSTGQREYEEQFGCRDVLDAFDSSMNDRRRRLVRDLTVRPQLYANPEIAYRLGPIFGNWYALARDTADPESGGLGFTRYLDPCYVGDPGPLTFGYFERAELRESDDVYDLGAQCFEDYEGDLMRILLDSEGFSPFAESIPDVRVDGNSTLIAADFDGDGTDDLATVQGVMKVIPRNLIDNYYDVDAERPLRFFTDAFGEENATLALDFAGDGVPWLITAYVYDSGSTQYLVLDGFSPFSALDDGQEPGDIPVCGVNGDCPDLSAWNVMLAKGQLDDDLAEELVVAVGGDADTGRLFVFDLETVEGGWNIRQEVSIPSDDFHPATLAVGELIGGGFDEIVLGGYNSDGTPLLLAIQPDGDCDGACYYSEAVDNPLPAVFRESFVGDFDAASSGPELVLTDASTYAVHYLSAATCTPDSSECLTTFRTEVFGINDGSMLVDDIAAADLLGEGILGLIVSARFVVPSGTLQGVAGVYILDDEVQILDLMFWTSPYAPCKVGARSGCVEPALGPLVGDVDNDGIDDVVIGWMKGQLWEASTSLVGAYFFGATVSERGSSAALTDFDANGLRDVLVLEEGPDDNLWFLAQEFRPLVRIIQPPVDFLD